jgi:uncharacterized RDD family membrane protein YckC
MKILSRPWLSAGGLCLILALPVWAQPPASPPMAPDRDDSGDFPFNDWSQGHGRKNDRVQIFGSNDIAADEKVSGDAVAVMGSNAVEGAVSHDVVAVMGSNTIDGSVGHDAVAVMGQAIINGTVGHNVVAVMGSITLGPNAVVRGDVVSVGGSIHRSPGAIVRGHIVSRSYNSGSRAPDRRVDAWDWRPDDTWGRARPKVDWLGLLTTYRRWVWILTLCSLAFYCLLALVFPRAVRQCGDTLAQRPGAVILTTFLALLALPLLFLLLCVTVIGIPLAVLFLPLGILASLLFGKAALYALIGRKLTRDRLHPAGAVLVGGLLCGVLYWVPGLGFLFSFFLSTLGFGCVVATLLLAARPAVARVIPPAPVPPVMPPPLVPQAVPAPAVPAAVVSESPPTESQAELPPMPPPPVPPVAPPFAAVTLPRAGFWIRMGALLIDAILVGFGLHLLLLPTLFIPHLFFLFFSPRFLVLAAYGALMWKFKGTTVGGLICGLQVVRVDGRTMAWDTAIVRALGCFLSAAVFFLGFLWIAFDAEKQAWHDKIAGTVVVRAKGIPLV